MKFIHKLIQGIIFIGMGLVCIFISPQGLIQKAQATSIPGIPGVSHLPSTPPPILLNTQLEYRFAVDNCIGPQSASYVVISLDPIKDNNVACRIDNVPCSAPKPGTLAQLPKANSECALPRPVCSKVATSPVFSPPQPNGCTTCYDQISNEKCFGFTNIECKLTPSQEGYFNFTAQLLTALGDVLPPKTSCSLCTAGYSGCNWLSDRLEMDNYLNDSVYIGIPPPKPVPGGPYTEYLGNTAGSGSEYNKLIGATPQTPPLTAFQSPPVTPVNPLGAVQGITVSTPLADAVKTTFGPKGRNVALDKEVSSITVSQPTAQAITVTRVNDFAAKLANTVTSTFGLAPIAKQTVTANTVSATTVVQQQRGDLTAKVVTAEQMAQLGTGAPGGIYQSAGPDSDGDGITDDLDQCPNTPAGVKVDANGCPLDSDKDGVPDYLDKCSNTPHEVKVDADGCCPTNINFPPGALVDANHCPICRPSGSRWNYDLNCCEIYDQTTGVEAGQCMQCVDSDGGHNYTVKGTTTNGIPDQTRTDTCYDPTKGVLSSCSGFSCKLEEFFCGTGLDPTVYVEDHSCPLCQDGQCLSSTPICPSGSQWSNNLNCCEINGTSKCAQCFDSDGGHNYSVKGTTSNGIPDQTRTDTCYDPTKGVLSCCYGPSCKLEEFFCGAQNDPSAYVEEHFCPLCQDGQCVSSSFSPTCPSGAQWDCEQNCCTNNGKCLIN